MTMLGRCRALLFAWVTIAMCAVTTFVVPSYSAEVISIRDDLAVMRDFAHVVLNESDVKNKRAFVDIDRLVVPQASAAENAELRRIAIQELSEKLKLSSRKKGSDYIIQIRMEEYMNYAIRNPQRQPARGYVMASICKYPIKNVDVDCENTEYFYFYKTEKIDVFKRVFTMWMSNLIASNQPR